MVENAPDPRLGVAVRIPRLNWVFHGFYGVLLSTASAADRDGSAAGFGDQPELLRSVRCVESATTNISSASRFPSAVGCWKKTRFKPRATNWLDHSNIGESNIFWPLTWDSRFDSGLGNHAAFAAHLASRAGPCGLLESDRAGTVAFHRRPDLSGSVPAGLSTAAGLFARRPRSEEYVERRRQCHSSLAVFASTNVYYGSGFTNGIRTPNIRAIICPSTRPSTFPRKELWRGEKYKVSVTALNVANRRVLLDNSLTFGGFHFNDPRQIYVEFRYRFHY